MSGKGNTRAALASQEPDSASRRISFRETQLRDKFKHAAAFGVKGGYSLRTARAFADAIEEHVRSPETILIEGTYRGNRRVRLFVSTGDGRMVMTDLSGDFVSAWILSDLQLRWVIERGTL